MTNGGMGGDAPAARSPADDRSATIEALLVQTATAHGVFEKTELGGVYDQAWPRWYATYAVEHGLDGLLGHAVTLERLAEFLATSNAEYEATEPESRGSWPAYTARRISAEL